MKKEANFFFFFSFDFLLMSLKMMRSQTSPLPPGLPCFHTGSLPIVQAWSLHRTSPLEERERRQRSSDVPLHTRTCSAGLFPLTCNGYTSSTSNIWKVSATPTGSDPEKRPESCSPESLQDRGRTDAFIMWVLKTDLSSC